MVVVVPVGAAGGCVVVVWVALPVLGASAVVVVTGVLAVSVFALVRGVSFVVESWQVMAS